MVKRKLILKDLHHNVAPHGSLPNQVAVPVVIPVMIMIWDGM